MNALTSPQEYGQAVWLDFVARRFLTEGGLKKLIDEDGLRGVTSNPAIFEKAIGHSEDYDGSLKAAEAQADLEVKALYERLAVEDIQQAAEPGLSHDKAARRLRQSRGLALPRDGH
jgi:transaldolase / glucose-6-phosphate isomerase